MQFKFRHPYPLDNQLELYKQGEAAYQAHLAGRRPHLEGADLWRFFASDFFHDGAIRAVGLARNFRDVELRIECPNIRARLAGGAVRPVQAAFTCRFHLVDFFQIDNDEERDLSSASWDLPRLACLFCEIDTLAERIEAARQRWLDRAEAGARRETPDFHSLILMTDQSQTISLVFHRLEVIPDEPLAFELMLKSPDHLVPLHEDE